MKCCQNFLDLQYQTMISEENNLPSLVWFRPLVDKSLPATGPLEYDGHLYNITTPWHPHNQWTTATHRTCSHINICSYFGIQREANLQQWMFNDSRTIHWRQEFVVKWRFRYRYRTDWNEGWGNAWENLPLFRLPSVLAIWQVETDREANRLPHV